MSFFSFIKFTQITLEAILRLSLLQVIEATIIIIRKIFFIIRRQNNFVDRKNNLSLSNNSFIFYKSKRDIEYL